MTKQNRLRALRDFFIGFLATTLLMLPLFFGAYRIGALRQESSAGILPAGDTRTDVPLSVPLSFNLLLVLEDSLTGELVSATLLRLDTAARAAATVTFPAMTVALWEKTPLTLYSVFAQRGAAGVERAVTETLSVPVSGTLCLTTDSMSALIDRLGGFPFTLEKTVEVTDVAGRTLYTRQAGSARLWGPDAMQLVANGGFAGNDLLRLYERLWGAALSTLFTGQDAAETLASAVQQASEEARVPLNTVLLGSFGRAAAAVCGPDCVPKTLRLEGVFVDNRFELSQGADEKLWSTFSKV